MKILTISSASWNDTNAVGNTLSNWFGGGGYELYSIYTREEEPQNDHCYNYYQISIRDILCHLFCPWEIGKVYNNITQSKNNKNDNMTEKRIIASIHGVLRKILLWGVDILYSSKIWLNKKIKNYLREVNPDIVFCFAITDAFRYYLVHYIKNNMNAKIVLFIADDVYSQAENSMLLGNTYKRRYKKLFQMVDKVYGASELLCKEYSERFKIKVTPLYKGCSFTTPHEDINTPLKIVYAGNLLYGRDKSLSVLANAISNVNKDGIKVKLEIYSPTIVNDEAKKCLNVKDSSCLCGVKPYSEIVNIMRNADIVLHVESFEQKQIEAVRLSFSTKISDCMQAGTCMMVIGPKGIASVEYPRTIEGVYIVDDLNCIENVLRDIVNNPKELMKRKLSLHNFAHKYHEISTVRNSLKKDFMDIVNGSTETIVH